MDTSIEKYYDALMTMFATEGWKVYIEDVAHAEERLDRISGIKTEQQLNYQQGQLASIRATLALEDTIRAAREAIEDAEADALADAA